MNKLKARYSPSLRSLGERYPQQPRVPGFALIGEPPHQYHMSGTVADLSLG